MPWSTCPITVTIGGLGLRLFGSSLSSSCIDSSISAVTNSTTYPNSSATNVKISASSLWFIVTIIPRDIQAEIISFPETSIIVAISPTVINSVTFITFFSASVFSISSSVLFLWVSLFSFLYFDALDFEEVCNFSRVSLICFWTSSSDGANGLILPLLNFKFSLLFVEASLTTTSFAILLLFFFVFWSALSDSFFLRLSKSIVWPVCLSPESFSYLVSILVGDFSIIFLSSTSFTVSTFFSVFSNFSLTMLDLFKSISPTFLNCWIDDLDVIVCLCIFNSLSFSACTLISSFSFFFSSLRSWDSTLLDRSELNSFSNKSYWVWDIFVVGRASISCPFVDKNSTTLSSEILNSLITLFNLILFNSDIYLVVFVKFLT